MKLLLTFTALARAQEGFDYADLGELSYDDLFSAIGDFAAPGDGFGEEIPVPVDEDLSALGRREPGRRPAANRRPGRPGRPAVAAAAPVVEVAAEPAADVNDERYFFTATTTTTTTVSTATTVTVKIIGEWCWKCDQMSYASCASQGKFQFCEQGDKDCCFVEVREKYGHLRQLCTGCKAKVACTNLMKENFNPVDDVSPVPPATVNLAVPYELTDQCRPDYISQNRHMRYGAQSSVCRQCFQTCNKDHYGGAFCFGSINDVTVQANLVQGATFNDPSVIFRIPFATHQAKYPEKPVHVDMDAIGIPTHALVDVIQDTALVAAIKDFSLHNVYFGESVGTNPGANCDPSTNLCHGKTETKGGNGERDLEEMVYWGLQGAKKKWWQSDLKAIQDTLSEKTQDSCLTPVDIELPTFHFKDCSGPVLQASSFV